MFLEYMFIGKLEPQKKTTQTKNDEIQAIEKKMLSFIDKGNEFTTIELLGLFGITEFSGTDYGRVVRILARLKNEEYILFMEKKGKNQVFIKA